MQVPAHQPLMYSVNYYGAEDLSFLTKMHDANIAKIDVRNLENVSDKTLVHLKGFNKLHILLLTGTDVTDAGLVHLSDLTSLHTLELIETLVRKVPVWLPYGNLPELWDLRLAKTNLSKCNFADLLPKTPNLRLNVNSCGLSNASLEQIGKYTNICDLDLSMNNITNAGLASLKGLKNLRLLNLISTRISGDAVDYLKVLPNLVTIKVSKTLPELYRRKACCWAAEVSDRNREF